MMPNQGEKFHILVVLCVCVCVKMWSEPQGSDSTGADATSGC